MAYVLLAADESFARHSPGMRGILQDNRRWAEQVAAAQPYVEAHVVSLGRGAGAEQVWPTIRAAYERAAQRAGTGGVLGVLMGHGGGGGRSFVDLAPPPAMRVYEDDLHSILRRERMGSSVVAPREQAVVYLRSSLSAYLSRIDLLTCNLGTGPAAPLLDRLRAVWRKPVRGVRGRLVSSASVGRPVFMSVQGHQGSWRDEILPDRVWRRAELLERTIQMPRGFGLPY